MADAVIALVAACLGGALSAFGAWLAIGRQLSAQRENQKSVAREFFDFILQQQVEALQKLVDYRSANGGSVSYLYVNALTSNHQMFERNREWLIWISGPRTRTKVLDASMQIALWADQVGNAARSEDAAVFRLTNMNSGEPAYLQVQSDVQKHRDIKDNLFTFVPAIKANLDDALASVTGKEKNNG